MGRKIHTEETVREELLTKRPDLTILKIFKVEYIWMVSVICENNHNYITRFSNLMAGKKCKICSGQQVYVGVNDLETTRPDLLIYLKDKSDADKYMENSGKFIDTTCPVCKNEKRIRVQHLSRNGIGCIYCTDNISLPNKFLRAVLKQINLPYELEVGFDGKKYRYDGLIDGKYIIEMHGIQHYKTTSYGNVEVIKLNDSDKKVFVESIGLKYIEVDCRISDFDFIKKSFINSLSECVDLSNINWDKVFETMNMNILTNVCKRWEEIKIDGFGTSVLCQEYMLEKHTIIRYLKTGMTLGLCSYDPKEEMAKSARRNWKYKTK